MDQTVAQVLEADRRALEKEQRRTQFWRRSALTGWLLIAAAAGTGILMVRLR